MEVVVRSERDSGMLQECGRRGRVTDKARTKHGQSTDKESTVKGGVCKIVGSNMIVVSLLITPSSHLYGY